MIVYAISPLFCAIFAFTLGFFVLFKSPTLPTNRSYALLCIETFCWQFLWFLSYNLLKDVPKDMMAKMAYSTILFLPFSHYHFVVRLLNLEKKIIWIKAFYSIAIFWLILLWSSNLFIDGYNLFYWGYYAKAGVLHPLYLLIVIFVLASTIFLLKNAVADVKISIIIRNQYKFVLLATCLYFFAGIEYVINYGVSIYPIGVFSILTSFSIIAFAMIKYNLMDIKAMAQDLLSWLLALIVTLSVVFLGYTLFKQLLSVKTILIFILGCLTGILILYPPFKYLQNIIGRTIRPRLNFADILKNHSEVDIMTIHTPKGLAELVVKRVSDTLKPTVCSIMLLDEASGLYNVAASSGKDDEIKTIAFKETNHLIRALKSSPSTGLVVKDELNKLFPEQEDQADLVRRDLEILQAQISIPLILDNKLIGLFNLGTKETGDLYTPEEVGFILLFVTQSALMMSFLDKIQKIHQLEVKTERLDALTNLLSSLNHEFLNQVFAPKLFLESLKESSYSGDELLCYRSSLAGIKNVVMVLESVTKYLDGRDEEQALTPTQIPQVINSALDKLKDEFKSIRAKITQNIQPNLPSIQTRPCFQYLFINLFRNCYFSLAQRDLRLLNIQAYQTQDTQRPIEIKVTDTGGDIIKIMKDKIIRVGGEDCPERANLGGVNFFVAKMVVEDHGGELLVETNTLAPEKIGTIFTIKLPLTQTKPENDLL